MSRRPANLALLLCAAVLFVLPLRTVAAEPDAAAIESNEATELGEAPVFTAGPLEYRPGRGLRLGSSGFVLGGFTNIKAETTEEAGGEFALDTLNFFIIFDRFTRFRAVAELQMKDIFDADSEHAGTQDFAFDVRRLFGDFTIADPLHVRAGTFLTPVGYWNLLLAPPLTWTTEPPLMVEETFFQATTTGVMIHGSAPVGIGQLSYGLFSQFLDPLEDDPDLIPPDHSAGFRLEYAPTPAWSLGATYQGAELAGDWSHLGALHAQWQLSRGEILSELYYQDGLGPGDDEGRITRKGSSRPSRRSSEDAPRRPRDPRNREPGAVAAGPGGAGCVGAARKGDRAPCAGEGADGG